MKLRPWLSPTAKAQAVREDVWWQTNRPSAPNAFWEELHEAIELLRQFPDSGVVVRRAGVTTGLRRVLLPTSNYHVYFLKDEAASRLRIYAIWSAERGKGPRLPGQRSTRRRR